MLEGIDVATGMMDDILIAAPTMEQHDSILCKVVERTALGYEASPVNSAIFGPPNHL